MPSTAFRAQTVLTAATLILAASTLEARDQSPATAAPRQQARPTPTSDLDVFMEKVLARRDVNRKTLNDYVLDETESFEILGPGRAPLHRLKREYTWYVRDGMHVRSPVRFDGVAVGEDARNEYEQSWIRRERTRRERRAKREVTVSGADLGPSAVATEPRFVSEAYFMDFKFEPGNYLLAGRETFEGHDVLRIEYYPTRLFRDDDEPSSDEGRKESREDRRERERDDDINRQMNKTALVTLWIDPAEHQIVKYTFDNVGLDFLPGAWLVRVDDVRASMTMSQPFHGVWLPREITIHGGATLANGSFEVSLSRAFSEYREAQVSTKVRVPQAPRVPQVPQVLQIQVPEARRTPGGRREHGPSLIEMEQEIQEVPEGREYSTPTPESRIRRLALTSDDIVWYVDSSRGYLGRLDPATGEIKTWPSPSGRDSHPYAIEVVDDIVWYNESAQRPDALVRFDPRTEMFQSWAIPSGVGIIRHMRATPDGNLAIHQSSTNTVGLAIIGGEGS